MKKLLLTLTLFSITRLHAATDINNSLIEAVKENNLAEVSKLLKEGANPNCHDSDHNYALHIAAQEEYVKIAQKLLERGAEVNRVRYNGETPLHLACKWMPITSKLVTLLLDHGANVHAKDWSKRTPLMVCCTPHIDLIDCINLKVNENKRAKAHLEVIHALFEAGASIDDKQTNAHLHELRTDYFEVPEDDYSALHCILREPSATYTYTGYEDENFDPSALGEKALEMADRHVPRIMKILIDKGANVNAQGPYGTPLHQASHKKEIVKLLLSKGANVHIKNFAGQTPLHECSPEVARLLVAQGADVNSVDNEGNTPLHTSQKNPTVFELVESTKKSTFLLKNGANVNQKNHYGATPLHYAYHWEQAKLLIDHNANTHNIDNESCYALHYAGRRMYNFGDCSEKDVTRLLDILLKNGCSINQQNTYGETPLHEAVMDHIYDGLRIISGYTHHTSESSDIRYKVIHYFLKHEANPNITDNNGNTPLDILKQQMYPNEELINLIKQHINK